MGFNVIPILPQPDSENIVNCLIAEIWANHMEWRIEILSSSPFSFRVFRWQDDQPVYVFHVRPALLETLKDGQWTVQRLMRTYCFKLQTALSASALRMEYPHRYVPRQYPHRRALQKARYYRLGQLDEMVWDDVAAGKIGIYQFQEGVFEPLLSPGHDLNQVVWLAEF